MYYNNDAGHGINHIETVINRSFELAPNGMILNPDIIYTAAAFHDVGVYISRAMHHIESAKILMNNDFIINYFDKEELKLIKDAIEDHRASLDGEPRSIYGKILSSADRPTDLDEFIYRSYMAVKKNRCLKNNGVTSNCEFTRKEIADAIYDHLVEKFGKDGYSKIYFIDSKYINFIKDANILINNKEEYLKRIKKIF